MRQLFKAASAWMWMQVLMAVLGLVVMAAAVLVSLRTLQHTRDVFGL